MCTGQLPIMTDTVTAATLMRFFGATPRAIGGLIKRNVI